MSNMKFNNEGCDQRGCKNGLKTVIWALCNESQTCSQGSIASKETPSSLELEVPEKITYQCQS